MEYLSLNKTTISAEARAAQQHLAGLGAPEALLEILAEKDLLVLKEAELVQEVPMDAASAEFAGEKRSPWADSVRSRRRNCVRRGYPPERSSRLCRVG